MRIRSMFQEEDVNKFEMLKTVDDVEIESASWIHIPAESFCVHYAQMPWKEKPMSLS